MASFMDFMRSWGRAPPPSEPEPPPLRSFPQLGLLKPMPAGAFQQVYPPPPFARTRANTSHWPPATAFQTITKPPPMPQQIPQQYMINPNQPRTVKQVSRSGTPTRVPGRLQPPGLMQPRLTKAAFATLYGQPRPQGVQPVYPTPPTTIQAPVYSAVSEPKPPSNTVSVMMPPPQASSEPRRSRAASEVGPTAQSLMSFATAWRSCTPQPQRTTGSNASVASSHPRQVIIPVVRASVASCESPRSDQSSPRPDMRMQILTPSKPGSSTTAPTPSILPVPPQRLEKILLRPPEPNEAPTPKPLPTPTMGVPTSPQSMAVPTMANSSQGMPALPQAMRITTAVPTPPTTGMPALGVEMPNLGTSSLGSVPARASHTCSVTEQMMQRMMDLLIEMAEELNEIRDMLKTKQDTSIQTEVVHAAVMEDGRSSYSSNSHLSLTSSLKRDSSEKIPSVESIQQQDNMSLSISDEAEALLAPIVERRTEPTLSGSQSAPAI